MVHMLENAAFFHMALGINAGLPFFTCLLIQKTKPGIDIILRPSKTGLLACRILSMFEDSMLLHTQHVAVS